MKKSNLNFLIDAIMFMILLTIAGLGFLMKYVLIPGEQRWVKYGENVDLSFWGLDRHQWGSVHTVLGYIFLGLLVLHILLHWKWIVVIYHRLVDNTVLRYALGGTFVLASLILLTSSFFISPRVQRYTRGRGNYGKMVHVAPEFSVATRTDSNRVHPIRQTPARSKRTDNNGTVKTPAAADSLQEEAEVLQDKSHHSENSHQIRGYMNLAAISNRYGVPIDHLIDKLELPSDVSSQERLGWLRRKYSFKMSDIGIIIDEYNSRRQ
jgi:hypothetical protein